MKRKFRILGAVVGVVIGVGFFVVLDKENPGSLGLIEIVVQLLIVCGLGALGARIGSSFGVADDPGAGEEWEEGGN